VAERTLRASGRTWKHQQQAWNSQPGVWDAGDKPGRANDKPGAPANFSNYWKADWENKMFFGNVTGALGNHSYYLSFNDFSNSFIQSVFLSLYIAISLHAVYLDWVQAVLKNNVRCTCK